MDGGNERFLAEIDVAIALLVKHGHEHWVRWLRADRARLRQGDPRGLSHLREAYGGMGSLRDVRLENAEDDERLDRALVTMYDAVLELQSAGRVTPVPRGQHRGS